MEASLDIMEPQAATIALMKRVPLIDGHNDWANLIRGFYDNRIDTRFQYSNNLVGHVDIKRLKKGLSGGIFLSAYVDCPDPENDFSDNVHLEPMRETLQQIDLIQRLVEFYPEHLQIANTSADILRIFGEGRIAGIISIEGLHQIGNSSSALRCLYRLGVRCVTLTHNRHNIYADCAVKGAVHHGLSQKGREVVLEINRIGMMIDLSHVSHDAMRQVLDISQAPVVFTHSSCYELVPVPRNVPSDVIDKLKINKGVIMISFIPALTHRDQNEAGISDVIDHILYVGKRIGFDHVGLGSDFDGMERGVRGLEDVSKFPDLVACMLSRGICEQDVEKVIGLNVIRAMRDIEEVAGKSEDVEVLEDQIKQLWSDEFRGWVRSKFPESTASNDVDERK